MVPGLRLRVYVFLAGLFKLLFRVQGCFVGFMRWQSGGDFVPGWPGEGFGLGPEMIGVRFTIMVFLMAVS